LMRALVMTSVVLRRVRNNSLRIIIYYYVHVVTTANEDALTGMI